MGRCKIGMFGLGVMGRSLALNFEEHGIPTAVYSVVGTEVDAVLERSAGNLVGAYDLKDFCDCLDSPRVVFLMVRAGEVTDRAVADLMVHLEQGDIIIDGGNTYFKDTISRSRSLAEYGIHFFGVGVSGGEEGARHGPSLMPGGNEAAYRQIEPLLTTIAASVKGEPCCAYIGGDGAGHFVKMVHNGIEYCDMQLICEAYDLLRQIGGLKPKELYQLFSLWNQGELGSYLIQITADIFTKVDRETGLPLVDVISSKGGQKGTGNWMAGQALELGCATPTVTAAVFARVLSAGQPAGLPLPTATATAGEAKELANDLRKALYAAKICAYAQGFALLQAASREYGWNLNLGKIARIFRAGCIIRAQFLDLIDEAYGKNPGLANLLDDPYFAQAVEDGQAAWRRIVCLGVRHGIALPAFSSALSYLDALKGGTSPHNLLQAQRDYFGAHTFQRVDQPGNFHYNWMG